jgi:hypothetical protein
VLLWGKVFRAALLVFAAVFTIVAMTVERARGEALLVAAVLAAAAVVGVPLLLRGFAALAGDERLLADGRETRAEILRLQPTRWRFNRYYPVVRFELRIEGDVNPVEVRQAVDPRRLSELQVGDALTVRVDPEDRRRAVIDWRGES